MKVRNKHKDEEDVEISMSPLIDCVFLLLIFFLVTAMLKKPNKDINIDLPSSSAAVEMDPNDDTVIGIDSEGYYHYNGVEISKMGLRRKLYQISLTNPSQGIRLDVDKKTKYIDIAEITDLCNFYQINNVGFRTYDESYNQ